MPSPPNSINFNINRFDMGSIGTNKVLIFIGMRGTGKSTLLLDYLYHNQDIPFITCVSPTDEYNRTFKPHIPELFIFDKYTEEVGANFLKRQQDISKKCADAKEGLADPRYLEVDPRGCLILDDCLADAKAWIRDPSILWMFMNGRHANITLIITMQYVMDIPPNLRTNVDFVFICREPKIANRKKLLEHYCGIFPNFDMFSQVLAACTNDHSAMVIHNTSKSDRIEDQAFWYKAVIHGDFKLCYDVFWQYQKTQKADYYPLLEEDREPQPANPYSRFNSARNHVTFNVNRVADSV